jgi:hypothetical protein
MVGLTGLKYYVGEISLPSVKNVSTEGYITEGTFQKIYERKSEKRSDIFKWLTAKYEYKLKEEGLSKIIIPLSHLVMFPTPTVSGIREGRISNYISTVPSMSEPPPIITIELPVIEMEELRLLHMEIENMLKILERGRSDEVNQYFKEQATEFKIRTYNLKGAYKLIATALSEYMFKVLSTHELAMKKDYIHRLLEFIDTAQEIIEVATSLDVDLCTELNLEKIGELDGEPIYSIRDSMDKKR